MDSPIVERIRKLQALAERGGTEHEAALAAARVAELCLKHQLEIGSILLAEQETKASQVWITFGGSWRNYRGDLCGAVCALLDVNWYRSRWDGYYVYNRAFDLRWAAVFYGLKANVEAAVPTYKYFEQTVTRLLRAATKAGLVEKNGTARRSFKVGCADRIVSEARKLAAETARQQRASKEAKSIAILSDRLRREMHDALKLRPMRDRSGSKDWASYRAGFSAGGDVKLKRASRRLLE